VIEQSGIEFQLPCRNRLECDAGWVRLGRKQVVSTGEQQAVDLRYQCSWIRLDRKIERNCTSALDRARVRCVDVVVVASGLPAAASVQA